MIIQCPRCSTRWRVGDPSATDNPTFKCGRCHHVFPQFPGAPPAAERSGGKARSAPPAPDNLEFIFPRRATAAGDTSVAPAVDAIAPLRDIVHDPPRAAQPVIAAPASTASLQPTVDTHDTAAADRGPAGAEGDDLTLRDDELGSLLDEALLRADRNDAGFDEGVLDRDAYDDVLDEDVLGRAADAVLDDERDGAASHAAAPLPDTVIDHEASRHARVLDMEVLMSASARIDAWRPATRLLVILVAAFALLALFVRANPERVTAWLARVPLVGGALAAEPALSSRITLTDVHGGYQQLRSGRRIFVISGKAINNSLVPVERIEVQGELYAASGAVARKVISTGNRTTLKLRDLSESEIALLQNLDSRQPVAPGGSVDFAIVFLEPPRDLREFSSRVLTARSTGRGSSPPDQLRNPASVG
jgi:predicted Zn finger-like uncharacterized protein